MNEKKRMRRLEPIATNILGKESFFGPNSLQILENRIFDLTGSKVKFLTTLHRIPSLNELEKGKQKGDKLVFIPDTMFVAVQRGEEVKNPRPTPITLENLFELFYSQTEAKTILRMYNESHEEMSRKLVPNKPLSESIVHLKDRAERNKKVLEKLTDLLQKFEGGVLNLGGLKDMIGTTYNKKISGGYHFIGEHINQELIDPETFAAKNGSRLPSIMELFLTQLILSASDYSMGDGSAWFPANSSTIVYRRDYVTCSKERGVGVSSLRNDIPQYRKKIITIK